MVLWPSGPRLSRFAYGTVTRSGRPFQLRSATLLRASRRRLNPEGPRPRFGLFRFRSPLLAECSLFLRVLRCFSSPGSPPPGYGFTPRVTAFHAVRFPHSDITGSPPAHGSPMLFAVCHVLHRLLTPRHPPFACLCLSPHPETARRLLSRLDAHFQPIPLLRCSPCGPDSTRTSDLPLIRGML